MKTQRSCCIEIRFAVGKINIAIEEGVVTKCDTKITSIYYNAEQYIQTHSLLENISFISRLSVHESINVTLAFVQAIEQMLSIQVPKRSQYVRTILCEGERIISHLLTLGNIAFSIGVHPLYAQILHIHKHYELLCEKIFQRSNFVDFFVLGGSKCNIATELVSLWIKFFEQISSVVPIVESILVNNNIFKQRTSHLGIITSNEAIGYCLSGPVARASGVVFDVRDMDNCVEDSLSTLTNSSYEIYGDFSPILKSDGNVYARVLVYIEEIQQSINIMKQCLNKLHVMEDYEYKSLFIDATDRCIFFDLASIDFDAIDKGLYPTRRLYNAVECPNGEFGIYLAGDGKSRLQRCKINNYYFHLLQALEQIILGQNEEDVFLIISSLGLLTIV